MTTPEQTKDTPVEKINLAEQVLEQLEPSAPMPAATVPAEHPLAKFPEQPQVDTATSTPEPTEVDPTDLKLKQDSQFEDPVFIHEKGPAGSESTPMPTDHRLEFAESIEKIPRTLYSSTEASRRWGDVIEESAELYPFDEVARGAIERAGSKWRQKVETDAGMLGGGYPRFKVGDAGILSGDAAIMQIMQHRKLGAMFRMPLWNTGIWITFKAPAESSLLELHRSILDEKVTLGRSSYGLSYSHTTSIFIDQVTAFAFEHVHSTSVKIPSEQHLREIISCHDIPAIVIGLASTIWPNGFDYERACVADSEKCQHIVEEKISIPKTLLVDRSQFTNWQLTHMAKVERNSTTIEEVRRYKEELQIQQNRKVYIDKDMPSEVSFTLKTPTIAEYTESGIRWISELAAMVDQALNKEVSNDERNKFIINYGRASSMRQFGHWVSQIDFNQKTVNDRETIESALATLSADNELRVKFQEAIAKYQSDSTLTVAAIPSFKCPNCGRVNESSKFHPNITDAIPYDVYQTFFGLLVQRIRRISER